MKESAIPYSQISLRYGAVGPWKTATLLLERPDASNCIDESMAEEIRDACRRIDEDDQCRLLTVTGSGGCFSAGRAALDDDEGGSARRIDRFKVTDAVAALRIPVLMALNGDATGHGLELALAGDLRICSDKAWIALWEPGQPAMPWDGGTQRLPRLVGPAWALDMALTGRRLSAEEALNIGLVNRVAPAGELADAAGKLAEQALAAAPIAGLYAKEAVSKGMDLTLEQGMRLEADLSVILQSTADRAEGIASFKERRRPKFTGK